mgnify:CR=1 FL=1
MMKNEPKPYSTQEFLGKNYLMQYAPATYETPKYRRINLIRKGLPYSALAYFIKTSGLNQQELASILQVSTRTVQRFNPQQNLSPQVSEKLLALNDLYQQAHEALGGQGPSITAWLRQPAKALGNLTPLNLLDTFDGLQEVKNVLGRLEWGVYS